MIILKRPQTDPYFNLAAEEYLVKNAKEPLFMLWQNTNAVVVGKHQNALKEINLNFLQGNNIPVLRRISGGGTVFHDLGNLNYSFIDFGPRESLVNFKKYSQPILQVLQNMGIDAQLDGKSDLKINGLKFSGNASHVYKNTVLHHGTLLFNSELDMLEMSIKATEKNYNDKAVKSNRSKVTNIQSHLKEPLTLEEFKQKIINFVLISFPGTEIREFTKSEIDEIQKLSKKKYKSWAWNFGYSPRYQFEGILKVGDKPIPFSLSVKSGIIESIDFKIESDSEILKLQNIFIGTSHQSIAFSNLFDKHNKLFEQFKIEKTYFLKSFFGS